MENENIDYEKEASELKPATEFWKPEAGQHKVRFKSNGIKHTAQFPDEDNPGQLKNVAKVKFDIELFDLAANVWAPITWDINAGDTENSLWGQIVLVGKSNEDLIDQEVNIVVKGSGKNKDYSVLEALPLMNKKEEEVKS